MKQYHCYSITIGNKEYNKSQTMKNIYVVYTNIVSGIIVNSTRKCLDENRAQTAVDIALHRDKQSTHGTASTSEHIE